MRISDWSSDVCSSDLSHGKQARRLSGPPCRAFCRHGGGRARSLARDRRRSARGSGDRRDPCGARSMAALIGHHDAEKAFLDAWRGGRLHHAWLLAGPQGMGKAAFAARVARFLVTHGAGGEGNAATLDDPGDAAAAKLVDAGNHPELLRLERQVKDKGKDLARNITVDRKSVVWGKSGSVRVNLGG